MAASELVRPPPSPTSSATTDTSPAVMGACGVDSDETNHINPCDYTEIPIPEGHTDRLPDEWWKTGLAFLYTLLIGILTAVTLHVVHESMPESSVYPPLPDKFFDYVVDRIAWAMTVTEINGLVLLALWATQWLFLKHKSIVSRRFFFLLATLYMYRCVTMYITTLPVPSIHIVCTAKLHNDTTAKVWRLLKLMSGGGMAVTKSHQMCGDYLYSGHTVMLSLLYLFIKEYSPPSLWWYHWLCWLLSATGIICILISHEHYSIDIVIAYFFTTRLFWAYHEMANMHALQRVPSHYLSRTWWNPVFNFFEGNVQTTVPVVFTWPSFLPPGYKRQCSMVEEGEETNESDSTLLTHHWFIGGGGGIGQRDKTFSETVPIHDVQSK